MESIPGLVAAADISAKYLECVKMSNDFTVAAITADTDVPLGILTNKPDAAGKAATVVGPGNVVKARCGGAVSAGNFVGPDGDGELVARTIGTDITKYIIGIALEDAVDQQVIQVQLIGPMKGSASA